MPKKAATNRSVKPAAKAEPLFDWELLDKSDGEYLDCTRSLTERDAREWAKKALEDYDVVRCVVLVKKTAVAEVFRSDEVQIRDL